MNKITLVLSTLTAALAMNPMASADSNLQYNEHIDFASVVDTQPLYETISYNEPQRECHYEKRIVKHKGNKSKTPIILGTIIGGAIGNELGHKDINKKVGIVVGGILGGSIAKDISRNNGHHRHGHQEVKTEKVCTTTQHVSYRDELVGYKVTYKYHGRTYHTTMGHQPGDRIKIAVTVNPVGA